MSPNRRKGFTAKQSDRTSRTMQSSTIGTHVPQGAGRHANYARHMNAQDVGFSNARKGQRAVRGEVRNIGPRSTTRESQQMYARRTNHAGYAQEVQRTARKKHVAVIVVAILIVLAVGIGVGVWVFFGSLSSGYSLSRDNTPTNLVAQTQGQPYYALVTADLDKSDGSNDDVDALALVRIDESAKRVTVVSIPTKTSVKLSDGERHAIGDAVSIGGYDGLVSAVASLSGKSISHLVKADETGIRAIVKAMGGDTMTLSQEVDDPNAGYVYIPSGTQTLDGEAAMTFLRATNFKDGTTTQMANQATFLATVVEFLTQGGQTDISSRLDSISGCFQTDWDGAGLVSALSALSGCKATDVLRGSVPGYLSSTKSDALFVVSNDDWVTMMKAVDAGEAPSSGATGTLSSINPAAYTVTVRNGSGITGGAASVANILSGVGFNVTETGNADSFVYTETLVIYGNESLKSAAEAASSVLGVGRATESGVYYTYSTDLLVILGSDWKPTS